MACTEAYKNDPKPNIDYGESDEGVLIAGNDMMCGVLTVGENNDIKMS